MAIPETPRVIYADNTLEEVKCEIRFPPILAIESSAPANFQEAVRDKFPYFELRPSIKLPTGVPSIISQAIERDLSLVGSKSYIFSSEDRSLILALSRDNFSLTCRRYDQWEVFREHLRKSLDSLATIYRPSFFTHTCVRFKNSVRRGPLGLTGTPWSELLQPWISGPLHMAETAEGVEALQSRCLIRLPDNAGRVEASFAQGLHQPSKEPAFIIQTHVYNDDRKVAEDVLPRLDALNRQAGIFFRWCITDKLHGAMRPSPV